MSTHIGLHRCPMLKSEEALTLIFISKSFMAATGISISRVATNSSMDEYELKKLIVEKSGEIFLLVDSTKFDTISLMTYSSLENIDYILTNETPPKKYQDFFKKNKINLVTPPKK